MGRQWEEIGIDAADATDAAEAAAGTEDGDKVNGSGSGGDENLLDNNRYGFLIPESSRLLTEHLLEADAEERSVEAEAAAAKEAAARAFREAAAVDADSVAHGGGDLLSYDGVVKRLEERSRKTRAQQARAEVAALVRA